MGDGERRGGGDALTRRERQVALLVAIGHTRAHVARLLRLTPDEVSAQLESVRAKLRERRRRALGPLPVDPG